MHHRSQSRRQSLQPFYYLAAFACATVADAQWSHTKTDSTIIVSNDTSGWYAQFVPQSSYWFGNAGQITGYGDFDLYADWYNATGETRAWLDWIISSYNSGYAGSLPDSPVSDPVIDQPSTPSSWQVQVLDGYRDIYLEWPGGAYFSFFDDTTIVEVNIVDDNGNQYDATHLDQFVAQLNSASPHYVPTMLAVAQAKGMMTPEQSRSLSVAFTNNTHACEDTCEDGTTFWVPGQWCGQAYADYPPHEGYYPVFWEIAGSSLHGYVTLPDGSYVLATTRPYYVCRCGTSWLLDSFPDPCDSGGGGGNPDPCPDPNNPACQSNDPCPDPNNPACNNVDCPDPLNPTCPDYDPCLANPSDPSCQQPCNDPNDPACTGDPPCSDAEDCQESYDQCIAAGGQRCVECCDKEEEEEDCDKECRCSVDLQNKLRQILAIFKTGFLPSFPDVSTHVESLGTLSIPVPGASRNLIVNVYSNGIQTDNSQLQGVLDVWIPRLRSLFLAVLGYFALARGIKIVRTT